MCCWLNHATFGDIGEGLIRIPVKPKVDQMAPCTSSEKKNSNFILTTVRYSVLEGIQHQFKVHRQDRKGSERIMDKRVGRRVGNSEKREITFS
jgi:hypothetical protein